MENNQKQPFMEFPSVESRVIAGILFFAGTLIILGWAAINEPARMEEFTERFDGRSVETGAILFENNCASCHGPDGFGNVGVAPALNNPFLFGYDFLADYDTQITVLEDEIEVIQAEEDEEDAEQLAALEQELALVEAQRLETYETLRYDYAAQFEELSQQLAEMDAQIQEELDLSGTQLQIQVQQRTDEITALQTELGEVQALIKEAEDAGQTPGTADVQRAADLQTEITNKQAELAPLSALNTPRTDLVAKVGRYRRLNDAHEQVKSLRIQIAEIESQLAALSAEDPTRTTLETQIDDLQSQLSTQEGDRDTALQELVTAGETIDFDPDADSRLATLSWNGTLEDLIYTTLISGRPNSGTYWPSGKGMAAWSQDAGGPLRRDQIQNLTDYVLNWEREFTIEDIRNIRQLPIVPGFEGGGVCPDASDDADSCDIDALVTELDTLELDPVEGQALYSQNGCTGCHYSGSPQAPAPQGVHTRAVGYSEGDPTTYPTARHYLVQSIMLPQSFAAEGYEANAGLMPNRFGETLDIQELGNIVAYLESQDQ
jgi:mono/diheme cytochrome c family protein